MVKYVIKRNGTKEEFDSNKIAVSISNTNREVDEKVGTDEIYKIIEYISKQDKEELTTDEINSIIEDRLISLNKVDLVKRYILYNEEHIIKINTTDNSIISIVKNSNNTIKKQKELVLEECSKDISDRLLIPKHIVKAHKDGVLFFHGKEQLLEPQISSSYINMDEIINNELFCKNNNIKLPVSFLEACVTSSVIINELFKNQSGSITIDLKYLSKYLRNTYKKYFDLAYEKHKNKGYTKDECLNRASEDAVERRNDELKNGLFSFISFIKNNDKSIKIYINPNDECMFKEEYILVINEILSLDYLNTNITFDYVLDDNNILSGGEYDYLTRKAIEKNDNVNFISSRVMKEYFDNNVFPSIGNNDFLSLYKSNNEKMIFEGRFNQGLVTINLVQIAILSNKNEQEFYKLLDEKLKVCFEALMVKHNTLKGSLSDYSPIHFIYGGISKLDSGEKIDKLLDYGYSTLSLGYVGLNEVCILMKGKPIYSKLGQEFSVSVLNHLDDKIKEWKEETSLSFVLKETVEDNVNNEFSKIDREKFGIINNVTDKDYTLSFKINENDKIDYIKQLKFEKDFSSLSLGGFINNVKVSSINESVIKMIYETSLYSKLIIS